MITHITNDAGSALDARVEVADGKIALHSRGGAYGKPNLRNPDYREALVAILSRLQASPLEPVRVLVDSLVARKVPEAQRVVARRGELGEPVEELVAKIAKRVAAFGREPGASGHGNQNKRVLIEVPGVSAGDILAVLGTPSPSPVIYFNIGWMRDYAGAKPSDPTVGGHGWLADHAHGLECFNFAPTGDGVMLGYRPPGASEKINIDRLGAGQGDEAVEGVLVVWMAREPGSGKTLVVGWYRDATVYREGRSGPFRLNGLQSEYFVTAAASDAVLLPVGTRGFEVKSSRVAPGEGFGQKPTWYGSPAVDRRVRAYVAAWSDTKAPAPRAKGARAPRNTDPELRRKVEKAAVQHAWDYYEARYGKGCVESVEPFGRGWDLEVRSGEVEWLVEVKGLLGGTLACELTPNEYAKMGLSENRHKYVVYVVTNALAEEPAVPVPSVFTRRDDGAWRTDDGRVLEVAEKVGAVLTCAPGGGVEPPLT